jgi:hypothetical protein
MQLLVARAYPSCGGLICHSCTHPQTSPSGQGVALGHLVYVVRLQILRIAGHNLQADLQDGHNQMTWQPSMLPPKRIPVPIVD